MSEKLFNKEKLRKVPWNYKVMDIRKPKHR